MVNINPDFLEENWGAGESPQSRTVVGLSSSTLIPANNVAVIIPWNDISEEFGEKRFFDIGAPTIFTIPIGVTRVKLAAQFNLEVTVNTSHLNILLMRNGSTAFGWGTRTILSVFFRSGPSTYVAGQILTPPFEVTVGDTLSLQAKQPEVADRNLTGGSWFMIEDASR